MRLRNIPGSKEYMVESPYVVTDHLDHKGKWKDLFSNDNPIYIEIGMGKGQFIYTLASLNPDINYVGIEKYSSVLIKAVKKQEEETLPNLLFIRMDAEEIAEVFDTQEVAKIYLNFSDPWPKDRHAKRRLESRQFLNRYDQILKKDGLIEFKTDNMDLFDFALEEVEPAGWELVAMSRDLHHDEEMVKGNVMTEYEKKFSDMGNPIYKYIIRR